MIALLQQRTDIYHLIGRTPSLLVMTHQKEVFFKDTRLDHSKSIQILRF